MTDFFRFPTTPHLAWLGGADMPRDDKLLTDAEIEFLLAAEVVIEEKLDGANLGISIGPDGELRAQNRGQYLFEPHSGQFSRLPDWLDQHRANLLDALEPGLILFGEWCAARHSLHYPGLPDWYLVFDVYQKDEGRFWSTSRRNALAQRIGLETVPCLQRGTITLPELKHMVMNTPSRFRGGEPLEGVVVRRESPLWCEARAKLVRADFTQGIEEHWRRRAIEWNRIDWSVRRL